MELQDFLGFDINTNPIEYSENYGRLDEIEIYNYKTVHKIYTYDELKKFRSDLDFETNYIIHVNIYTYKDIEYGETGMINVLIDNCGNLYRTFFSDMPPESNHKEIKLINREKISKYPLNNFLIDKIKSVSTFIRYFKRPWDHKKTDSINFNNPSYGTFNKNENINEYMEMPKDFYSYFKKDKKFDFRPYQAFNFITYYYDLIRDINKYIYEKFAVSIDNFKLNEILKQLTEEKSKLESELIEMEILSTDNLKLNENLKELNESLKELTEEKAKLESELFVNSKSNEKLNVELESVMNDNHKLSSSLKESSIENEKLKRQLEERNNLIIELSIANRNNSNPPPYSI